MKARLLFLSAATIACISFTSCKKATCGGALADLFITSLRVSNYTPQAGQPVSIETLIQNAEAAQALCGDGTTSVPAAPPSTTTFKVSGEGMNAEVGKPTTGIPASGTASSSATVTFPRPGVYTITVYADGSHQIDRNDNLDGGLC